MSDDVQKQITWLLCFDDGEADHIGAARCAETMKSQQARIRSLEKVLEATKKIIKGFDAGYGINVKHLRSTIADCNTEQGN